MACCTARRRYILKRGNISGFYKKCSIQLTTHGWRAAYSIYESIKCSHSLKTRKTCVHEQEQCLLYVILLLTLPNSWENLFHLLLSSDIPLRTRKFVDSFDNVIAVFWTKWPALLCPACISRRRCSPECYVNLLDSGLRCVGWQLWFCNGLEWSMIPSLAVSSIFSFAWR